MEIGTATVKVVPDTTEVEASLAEFGKAKTSGVDLFWTIAALILLICSPAIIAVAYGVAF